MKYMFASDIHGSLYYCQKMLEAYDKEQADRMVILGDILYHGPRNDLPKDYNPKEVIKLLNERKEQFLAVQGNCDAQVDQMVLEFPIMAQYCILELDGHHIYATHGHVFHQDHMPPLKENDILIHGHTHVLKAEKFGKNYILNPGSVAIPKEGNPPTYGIWEEETFTIKDFEGNTIKEITWKNLN